MASMLEIHVKTGRVEALTVGFGQTRAILMDWRPAFREMHKAWVNYEEQVFASEGAAGLGKWAPLSPRYARWKALAFPGKGILTRTGRMRELAKRLRHISATRAAFGPGSDVPYAIFHVRGTRRMPRRDFFTPSRSLIATMREIARRHIVKARQAMKDAVRRG